MQKTREVRRITIYTIDTESFLKREAVDEFRADIQEIINSKSSKRVAIDFSKVAFASSLALGALVAIRKRLKEAGGELAVFGINETIEKVLRTMRLDEVFSVCSNEAEAISTLQAAR